MKVHANAALGPAGRLALVRLIESGMTLRAAAVALNVAPATGHRWLHRWLGASEQERRSGAWMADRSSCPHRQPRRLSAAQEEPILRARRQTNLGPGRLAGICRRARSTIWKVLQRHDLSRLRPAPKEPTRRYEWSAPGALIHVDTAQLPAFRAPGHRVRGRSPNSRRGRPALGFVYLHVAVDDRSRYAYVEQHPDQRQGTVAGFMERALTHFAQAGLGPPQAVMSDNGNPYRSKLFAQVLERAGARQIFTPPYTPRWNGKAERFIQTLKREWAHAHVWPSSAERSRALRSFVRYYNRRRPHSSLGGTGRQSAAFSTSVGRTTSLLAVRFADQARQESTLAGTAVHCGSRDARLERLALRVRGKTPPSRTAIGIEFWRETPVDQVLTRKQA